MRKIAKQIHGMVMAANRILLVPHEHPDGDALGSCAAFLSFLQSIGKQCSIFCNTDIEEKYNFLPYINGYCSNYEKCGANTPDLIIVFDSGDLRHAGIADKLNNQNQAHPPIIAIDHHISNELYGLLNLVIPNASSTAEVLYNFFLENNIRITKTMATCLLTGILTDTDTFTNSATSAASLEISRRLMMRGADVHAIVKALFRNKTINSLKIWGTTLSRLEKHIELDIIHTFISLEDMNALNVPDSDVEGIANYLNSLGEGRAILFLKELEANKWKGSFRTTRDDTDVSCIAKKLGGGGHKKAAGFTVQGAIDEALAIVFETIRETDWQNNS